MDKSGKRRLAAVMFTDIEGYTSLVSQNEEQALTYVRNHRRILTEKTEKYEGKIIEFYGDGSLSLYDSAVDAVRCAIEMQQEYGKEGGIPVRIGIHLGDISIREGSVFGNGVNVASRVESIGIAGNILISQQVNRELRNQAGIETALMGKFNFKNVKEPIAVYAIDHPEVRMPSKKQVSGAKGKRVKNQLKLYILSALAGITLLVFYLYYHGILLGNLNQVKDERIAVPSLKNFSGTAELDYIGEMAAHWITKELIKTEKANVVDFYSNNEIQQMSIAKVGDLNKIFAKQSGALNIVDGAFNRHAKDSLMFTAFIKKIDDGKILHTFDPVYFNIDEPTKGIKALANKVLGYWDARDDLLLSIPNFDSYKFYMDARSQWLRNDDMAKELLLKSIAADSSFLDPYLLLLGYYYNDRLYSDAHDLIDLIKRKTENLSSREKNVLEYMEAIIHGNNLLSYSIIIKDLEENERDFFTSTDFMIIAFELVNNPAKAIEVFVADPLEDMNLEDCMYCQERYYFAIASYLRLKQYDEAKILIEKLPDILNRWKYYGIQLRYFVRSGSKMAVEENLLKWKKYISVADYKALLYVAARENFLIGDEAEYKKYCTEILNFSKDSHWTNNWAHYFLQNYDEALLGFQDNIANNYDVLRSHSRVGAILAIQGNRDLALKKVEDLEDFRSDFDFGSISYNQARIYLKLGDRQKALALLETSVQEGARFNVNNVFENDPDFIELRDDPKFQRIIHPLENN